MEPGLVSELGEGSILGTGEGTQTLDPTVSVHRPMIIFCSIVLQ